MELWFGFNFIYFFTELTVPPQAPGVVETPNCVFLYIIQSTIFSTLNMSYYFYKVSFLIYISINFASILCLYAMCLTLLSDSLDDRTGSMCYLLAYRYTVNLLILSYENNTSIFEEFQLQGPYQ